MDLEMNEEIKDSAQQSVWDVSVKNGIVPIISGERENVQTASLACFLQKGTIPQLPDMGVPWTDFFMGEITFGELDADIRQSMALAGMEEYQPDYSITGDRLTLTVSKEQ